MIVNVCYNRASMDLMHSVCEFCHDEHPEIEVKCYDEDHFKEKKQAYRIKGGYSARKTPFMLLTTKDGAYLKAFYSEDNKCTLDSLETFLNNYYENTCNK